MADKRKVQLRITAIQDGEESVQEVQAFLYRQPEGFYLRYREPEESAGGNSTATTIKVKRSGVKLIRHGAVESEMELEVNRALPGYYRSEHAFLRLMAVAERVDMDVRASGAEKSNRHGAEDAGNAVVEGAVRLEYDLYINDQFAGHFVIVLDIREELEDERIGKSES